MSKYSTIESLQDSIGKAELINLVNDESDLEDEIDLENEEDPRYKRIDKVLLKVGEEIDSYLDNRYTLPFTTTPARLIPISDDLCEYYLTRRKLGRDMPEDVVDRYKMRLKDLEKIQKGVIDLGIEDQPNDMSSEVKINKTATDRIFNKDVLDKF